jgi:hypothetical protein
VNARAYTLAAGSVLLTRMPQTLSKKLPRYPVLPLVNLREGVAKSPTAAR